MSKKRNILLVVIILLISIPVIITGIVFIIQEKTKISDIDTADLTADCLITGLGESSLYAYVGDSDNANPLGDDIETNQSSRDISLDCPIGYVITGMAYADLPGTNVTDGVSIQCSRLNADGTLTDVQPYTENPDLTGQTLTYFECPANSIYTGIKYKDIDGITWTDPMDGLTTHCENISTSGLSGTILPPKETLQSNPRIYSFDRSNGCPAGYALTGIEQYTYFDAFIQTIPEDSRNLFVDGTDVVKPHCREVLLQCNSCGNNIVDTAAGETCDDANNNDFDSCNNNCQSQVNCFRCSDALNDENVCGAPTLEIGASCPGGSSIEPLGCGQAAGGNCSTVQVTCYRCSPSSDDGNTCEQLLYNGAQCPAGYTINSNCAENSSCLVSNIGKAGSV